MDAYEKAEAEYNRVRFILAQNRQAAEDSKDWTQALYWQLRLSEHEAEWMNTVFP